MASATITTPAKCSVLALEQTTQRLCVVFGRQTGSARSARLVGRTSYHSGLRICPPEPEPLPPPRPGPKPPQRVPPPMAHLIPTSRAAKAMTYPASLQQVMRLCPHSVWYHDMHTYRSVLATTDVINTKTKLRDSRNSLACIAPGMSIGVSDCIWICTSQMESF